MSGFALRLCPQAVVQEDLSWARMYKAIKQWRLDPKRPDILLIHMYHDLPFQEPDLRFEMRLYRKTDPADWNIVNGVRTRVATNPDQGFIIKCPSWEAWHFTPNKTAKDEYPHMPPHGYYLGEDEIKNVILPVIENYYKDIVLGKYHMETPKLIPLARRFKVASFDIEEEMSFMDDIINVCKEADAVINILIDDQ